MKKASIQQEKFLLQAAVITDNFDSKFEPISKSLPHVLFPLVNRPVLLYTLEFLAASGVEKVFVFSCHEATQIKESLNCQIEVISSPDYHSVGDVLRDIDQKSLFQTDFLLLNGDLVSNATIKKAIDDHRARREKDKTGPLMTLVLQEMLTNQLTRSYDDDVSIAVDPKTRRLLHYERLTGNKSNVKFPSNMFNGGDVDIHFNIADVSLSVCSPQVPQLYTDNFDYQTTYDFIRGILSNEEFYGNQIHIHLLKESFSARIVTFNMYNTVSKAITSRWLHPIVPENTFIYPFKNLETYSHLRQNVYFGPDVNRGQNNVIRKNVLFGRNCKLGNNCHISDSVIGHNCEIGDDVHVQGAYLWDNVKVSTNCTITKSILCNKVTINEGVIIKNECIIDQNTEIKSNEIIEGEIISNVKDLDRLTRTFSSNSQGQQSVVENPDSIWGKTYTGLSLAQRYNQLESEGEVDEFEDVSIEGSESEESSENEDVMDEVTVFYKEVNDSLQRAVEEKIQWENLVLEINSSKYAYNLTIRDIIVAITKSAFEMVENEIQSQEYFTKLKQVWQYLIPVITNYNKTSSLQEICLQTIEDYCLAHKETANILIKMMMLLYNEDVLEEEVILHWYNHPKQQGDNDAQELRKKVFKFIEWLENAEEEDD